MSIHLLQEELDRRYKLVLQSLVLDALCIPKGCHFFEKLVPESIGLSTQWREQIIFELLWPDCIPGKTIE